MYNFSISYTKRDRWNSDILKDQNKKFVQLFKEETDIQFNNIKTIVDEFAENGITSVREFISGCRNLH